MLATIHLRTVTLVRSQQVDTHAIVVTWIGSIALVDVLLTGVAHPPIKAGAAEPVYLIMTRAAILARLRETLINVLLAQCSFPASIARALPSLPMTTLSVNAGKKYQLCEMI